MQVPAWPDGPALSHTERIEAPWDGPASSRRLPRKLLRQASGHFEAGLARGRSMVMGLVSHSPRSDRWPRCTRALIFVASGFGLLPFLRNLIDAFGWRYCAAVVAQYGLNQVRGPPRPTRPVSELPIHQFAPRLCPQGAGASMLGLAVKFFAFSTLDITSATWGRLNGFASIPWQLKAIFGLLSDTVAIRGLHRSPYLLIAGASGQTRACPPSVLSRRCVAAVCCVSGGSRYNILSPRPVLVFQARWASSG